MAIIKLFNTDELLYPTITDSHANHNTLDIWIKFISYLNEEEKSFLSSINDKDVTSLTQHDLDRYYKIKTQLNMIELFKKYKNRECSKEEHDVVYNYMHNSLSEFVRSRMSEDEFNKVHIFINSLSEEKLKEYIKIQDMKYDDLSVYDAYTLFEAKECLYSIEKRKINKKIEEEERERARHLRISLIRDYGFR